MINQSSNLKMEIDTPSSNCHLPQIAIISDRVYPYFKGGAEKRYWEFSKNLVRNGFRICYYTGRWPGMPRRSIQDGIEIVGVYDVGDFYVNGRKSILETLRYTLGLLQFLALDSYDLIECEQFPIIPIFLCKTFSILKRRELVVTWHEVWGKELWKKYLGPVGWIGYFLEALSVHLPDKLISVSAHTTQRLLELYRVPSEKIVTIPNGIDFQWNRRLKHHVGTQQANTSFLEKRIPVDPSDIIYVGRLIDHKNVDKLLRTVAVLSGNQPDIKCLIIGDGPERESLEQLSHSLGLQNNICFKGYIENERRVYSFMEASRVFVSPSIREGFGISVIEANACGLPALVIDGCDNAAKDLIEEGCNGFICHLDEQEIARKISQILATPHAHYTKSCHEIARKYCWNELGRQVAEVYDNFLSRNLDGYWRSNRSIDSVQKY